LGASALTRECLDGYRVLVAGNGAEALELSRRDQGPIDLLVSDIQMPGMNGIDLAEHLCKERPYTKVLIISGSPDLEVPAEFRLLRKPFTPAALRQTLADLLAA